MPLILGPTSTSYTVLDIIKGALRPLNVLTGNTTLTDQEAQDALQAFNWMLDSFANEGTMLYHLTRDSFTLIASHQPHTYGSGGDFNAARPTRIVAASLTVSGVDYPVAVIPYDDWEAVRLKNLATTWPQALYYEPDYPLGKVWLNPIPTAGYVLNMQTEKPLGNFVNLTDTFALPPGYADALRYNLALRLAPEYQITAGQDLMKLAEKALRNIKRTNSRVPTYSIDAALQPNRSSTYNIYTDGGR